MVQGLKLASGLAPPAPEPEHRDLPRQFGDYELLDEIARGGMGVIYRARQRSLGRIVAVKMLLFGPHASPEYVKRFRAEASAVASLQHPNIVAIHEVGVQQGEHYLVMDLVDGPNLAQFIKDQPLSSHRAAGYLKTIAEAIHYAHERGILHRDLKPSNVLIDANDQPRVTDFGLAKRLEGDSSLTLSGQMLGSPSYMPPEQAGATHHKVGRRSDVYSLGAMLYHTLVGRPPFVGEGLNQMLDQVFNREPVSLRLLNPSVPRDLDTICLKCLEKEPEKRYATAQKFADELGRFLRDEPILARPVRAPEKLWRWCRRKPALAGALASALLLLILVAVGAPIAAYRINRERIAARQSLYAADMRVVQQAIEEGDLGRARELLAFHVPAPKETDLRGFEWRYFSDRARGDQLATIRSDADWRRHLALSSNSRFLAVGQNVYDAASGAALIEQQLGEDDLALAFAPDSHVLLISGREGLKRRDLSTGKEELITPGKAGVSAVAFSRTGRWLAIENRRGLRLYDARAWSLAGVSTNFRFAPGFAATALAFSPDESVLVTAAGDPGADASELQSWEVPSLKPLPFPPTTVKNAACIAFAPDGLHFFTACYDGTVRVWDAETRTELPNRRSVQHHRSWIADMAFLPGTHQLVTAGSDRCVRFWGTELAEPPVTARGHTSEISAMALATNGTIFTSSSDGVIHKWSARSAQPGDLHSEKGQRLVPVGLSADGLVAVTLADGVLKFWDLGQREFLELISRRWEMNEFSSVRVDPDRVEEAVSISPDLKWLVLVRLHQPAQLWNVSERTLRTLPSISGPYAFAVFSPDSKYLALPISTNAVALLDPETGRQLASIPCSVVIDRFVSFATGANVLAIGGQTDVMLWDLQAQRRIASFDIQANLPIVLSIALSPDAKLLATGSTNQKVRLYDCQTGKELLPPLLGHLSGVERVSFSPDGRTLVSASRQSVRLWNLATRREVASCQQPARVLLTTFSTDGTTLLTSDGAGRFIQIWRGPFQETQARTRGRNSVQGSPVLPEELE